MNAANPQPISLHEDVAFFGEALRFTAAETHSSVIGELLNSIGAILTMMGELGFAARPVIQALLTRYPRDFLDEVLRQLAAVD